MDKSTSDILKRILKASEQGNLTFFIGAGVSCLSQYPLWSELLDRILDKLKKRKETNASNISIENNLKIGKKTTYPKVTFDSEDSLFKDSANSANNLYQFSNEIDERYAKAQKLISNNYRDDSDAKNLVEDHFKSKLKSKDNYAKAQILYETFSGKKSEFIRLVESCCKENAITSPKLNNSKNDIYDYLLSLNPSSIITTNFDDLIEKSCLKKAENFVVVAKDKDVSNIQGQRFILKIHGDFKNKNIVFTENSYLDYEQDFSLISRQLTSVLATNTVVFIGYGLSDFNIRLLINLLKNLYNEKSRKKLKNSARPIFYSVTDAPLDEDDRNYFSNKGIDALDCYDLNDSLKYVNPKDDKNRFIKRYGQFFLSLDEVNLNNSTKFLCDSLQPLNMFNCITVEMLREKLSSFPLADICIHDSIFIVINEKTFVTYYNYLLKKEGLSEDEIKECDLISLTFIKAGIIYLQTNNGLTSYTLFDYIKEMNFNKYESLFDDCISFNYKKIESYTELRSKKDYKIRNVALYKLGKYRQLLNCFENNSFNINLTPREEIDFFISKVNSDYVKILDDNEQLLKQVNSKSTKGYPIDDKLSEKVGNGWVDLNKVNISKLFENRSSFFKKNYPFMKNFLEFPLSKESMNSFYEKCQRIKSLKEKNYISFNNDSKLVKFLLLHYYKFLVCNGILNDRNKAWKNVVIEVLRTVAPKLDVSSFTKKNIYRIKDYIAFDRELFFMYVEFFSSKDLIGLFKSNGVNKLFCGSQNEHLKLIEKSINNLLDFAQKNEGEFSSFCVISHGINIVSKIQNLIVICSYLSLTNKTTNKLVEFILEHPTLLFNSATEVDLFFFSILNKFHKDDRKLKNLISNWLKENLPQYIKEAQHNQLNAKYNYYQEFIHLFIDFLHGCSNLSWLDGIFLSVYRQRVKFLYRFFSEKISYYVSQKSKNESLVEAHLILESTSSYNIELVTYILANKGSLTEYEIDKLKEYLRELVKKRNQDPVIIIPDPFTIFYLIAYSCSFGKLSRAFDEFIGVDSKFDFLYLYKDFDFSKFNCDWLLPESVLSNFFLDKTVKLKIKKALKDKLKDPDLNQEKKSKFTDIFFKYFADD